MSLWCTCPNCGPVCAILPQGRVAFKMQITCDCGVTIHHTEPVVDAFNLKDFDNSPIGHRQPKINESSC